MPGIWGLEFEPKTLRIYFGGHSKRISLVSFQQDRVSTMGCMEELSAIT